MFQLTVEETIATLILLEDVINSMGEDIIVQALEKVHDELDYQMLSNFGLENEEEVGQEIFQFLSQNSKVKIQFDVDELTVEILKAIYSPLLQHDELTPEQKMQAAKILFKIS